MSRISSWWLSAGLASISAIANAAEPFQGLNEQDFYAEVPMVLTVSRLVQPISEAPAAVTVIDRDMIRTSGFRDLADLFRFVPGFYVAHFTGNEQVVTGGLAYRYFGRVQVLLDGKSVYTPIFGQVPWSALPVALEDIERIEVTRGPNAASYGANSFQGVINIITRHPTQDQGSLLVGRVGDPAVGDWLVRHAGKRGGLDYRVTLSHKRNNGFEDRNDDQRTDTISMRADYNIDNKNSLQFQAGYTGAVFGAGYFGSNDTGPRDQRAQSSFQQIVWRQAKGVDDELSVQFYHTYNLTHETFVTPSYIEGGIQVLPTVIRTDLDSERFDLEFQRNQRVHKDVRMAWGVSARLDRVRAPLFLAESTSFRTSRLQRFFLNAEWTPIPELVINGGAALEHNDIHGSDVSPRLALSYHLAPGHTVRVGVSRALRTPTVLEESGSFSFRVNTSLGELLVPRFFGNTNLQPERIINKEVAYVFDAPTHGFSADVRFYTNKIKGVIDPDSVTHPIFPDFFIFQNAADVTLRGVQTQARWRKGGTQINLAHAYTHLRVDSAINRNEEEDLLGTNQGHMLSALLAHRFASGWEASVGFYYQDSVHPIGDGTPLKSYRRWDARLAYDFKWGAQLGTLALVGQNLTKPYNEYRVSNEFGNGNEFRTRLLTTLSLTF